MDDGNLREVTSHKDYAKKGKKATWLYSGPHVCILLIKSGKRPGRL